MMRARPFVLLLLALLAAWPTLAQAGEKVIRMYAGGDNFDYSPTRDMIKSEANPYPHQNLGILARRWEQAHPGYRIEFVLAPPPDLNYRAWCVSNFVGGTIPDIIYQNMGMYRDSDFAKGWVMNMDPYLEKPNPYVPGNRRWLDQFYQPWVDAMRSLDGHCYWVCPDTIGVGIVCNMNILRDCGVTVLPRTVNELLAACAKVKAKGYIAYFPPYELFVDCVLPSVIWADQIPQMDLDHNWIVSQSEMTRGIDKKIFRADSPQFAEYLRIYKSLADYYPRGWNAMEPLYVFKQGKVAFMEAVGSLMRRIQDDPRRTFDFQVIPFPDVTREDSPYGGHPLAGSGDAGYTSNWQITLSAKNDGLVDACVDWLQFITAPENDEFMVNELGFTLPGVKGTKPVKLFQALNEKAIADISKPGYLDWHAFVPCIYTNEFTDNWQRIKQMVALDMIDIPEAQRMSGYWFERSYKSIMRKYGGQWDAAHW